MGSSKLYLLSFLLVFASVKGSGFDYGKQAKWLDEFPQCSLNRQSPIELISDEAEISYSLPDIKFSNYDSVFQSPIIQNNGHTANIALPKPSNYDSIWQTYDKSSPQVTAGPFGDAVYIAESVHFHWGSESTHGSEHVIDSKRYSMEMHIVHRNGKYQTVEDARENEDGLAVLSVMYEVESNKADFAGLEGVVSSLSSITEYDEEAEIEQISLSELLQSLNTNEYYTYQGSLTTPPCSQAVTWVVFASDLAITQSQVSKFRSLIDAHGQTLENNYRELQAKGFRKVTLRKSPLKSVWDTFNSA